MTAAPTVDSRDPITSVANQSWDQLFSEPREPVERFQLESLKLRFEQLAPAVKTLRKTVERSGVTAIRELNDAIPLLFQHTVYKSYPMSLLEDERFDLLTQWLDGLTTVDLSSVKLDGCTGIDQWLAALEAQTSLMVDHTTGTTGKLSFLPRSRIERDVWNTLYLKQAQGFGAEPCVKLGPDGVRMPVIFPSHRYGRYVTQRVVQHLAEVVAATPEQCYTLTNGTLSADLISLSGRIRVAQAKGELGSMQLRESMRVAMSRYLDELDRRPAEIGEFFARIVKELSGQRVLMMAQNVYLFQATLQAEQRGLSGVFAANSVCGFGGGSKGVAMPDDWFERVQRFTGIGQWFTGFGMSELNGLMPQCPQGHFHVPPTVIPYLLDPGSGQALPRCGEQTGRFAFYDLLAQTYWGGFVSGDKVTMHWDGACACGRKGAYLLDNVSRYSEQLTGDDKVSCSQTIDQTDSALKALLQR